MWFIHINRNVLQANARALREGRPQDVVPPVRFQQGRRGKPTYASPVRFIEGEVATTLSAHCCRAVRG
jgi:hypothetical protein